MRKGKPKKFIAMILTILVYITIMVVIIFYKGPNYAVLRYYYDFGYVKQKFNNLNGAINDYNKAIAIDKNYYLPYVSRGSAYLDLEEYDKAIQDYSMAIKLNPDDPRAYAYRGRAFYEIQKTTQSIQDFDAAIAIDNNFGYAFLNRGIVKYTQLSDFEGGCKDLKKADELGESEAKELLENGDCD